MESAQTIGFSDEAELKDRCQLQFLAQLKVPTGSCSRAASPCARCMTAFD